ncbi:type IV secretion system protein [Campylobacter vicugnae]|uniref:type IV secretion system protein n=1 Tax=Campylobacter vicugnae TaxID=1660076 RepID=UPI002549F9F3|nr:VirB8/TrbF family protein [Campylobacter ovis]MDL0096189.1 VirB8/TrbF family protein [Campylobacter ovis]
MDLKDKKKDPNYLFSLERNIKAYMLYIILILGISTILLSISIIVLTPLKETKPYLMFFSTPETNFVRVEPANFNIRSDQQLMKNILAGYVKNREMINRVNDIERYEIIRIQSSKPVWDGFNAIVTQPNSIYTTKNTYRNVKIINVTILNSNVATVDFMAQIFNQSNNLIDTKKYRASIKFEFKPTEDIYSSTIQNPTGFNVVTYALTDIVDIEDKKDDK